MAFKRYSKKRIRKLSAGGSGWRPPKKRRKSRSARPLTSSPMPNMDMVEKKTDEAYLVKQTLVSHILIKSIPDTSGEDAKARLEKLQERIINGDDFAEIARAHSDDSGSAIEGGSLGWTSPGVMVPEFEEVMNAMSIDETSDVFESRFGWHLLKVFDRREENMADEFKRSQARQAIHKRKVAEELESWLRQMRDEAYVEYRNH